MLDQALDWIINTLPGPVFVKDLHGRYVVVNRGTMRALGCLQEQDILGKTDAELHQHKPDYGVQSRDRDLQAMQSGRPTIHEVQYQGPDGIEHWFLSSRTALFNSNGEVIGVVGFSEEVTDQKRVDLAQKDNQELRTRFLNSASHDLRQPLQAMFMSVESLKRHVSPEGGSLLEQLEIGLRAQRQMLDGILDVSTLDAEIIKPDFEDFEIGESVATLLGDLCVEAERKGLTIENNLALGKHCIRTDRFLLGRILVNYVENAIRFTSAGSVRIEGFASEENLVICVSDTGIGIEQKHLDMIWNEFSQIGNVERRRKNGVGLGLTVVRRLAAILDCRVWVKSSFGNGSSFYVSVPLSSRSNPPSTEGHNASQSSGGPRLLFVDDDDLVRESFGIILAELGYNAIVAESTEDALAKLADSGAPSLMVLDYRLRDETGIDCMQAVRSRYGQTIPAILLTGDLQQSVQELARQNEMRLLHKPISVRVLETEIERLRNGSS